MTVEAIGRDELGKAVRAKVYFCQREALPWLMQLLDELGLDYDPEKIAYQRYKVWLYKKARSQRTRARKYGLTEHFTAKQLGWLFDYYGEQCVCCGRDDTVTLDHIMPLSMGGSNLITNIQITCERCNVERGRMGSSDDRRTSWPLWFREILEGGNE